MEKKIVMAVASKGGHWIQLQRLKPVWQEEEVIFVTTDKDLHSHVKGHKFEAVIDANMNQKFKLILQALTTCWLVLKYRPDVIISTGAAVGFFAIFFGRLINCKTIWLDSVANAEELSLAGSRVGKYADIWLTQWPNLVSDNGPKYRGKVF
jgi:UDP-N-acetylglucosamine:LPS N-acetylglucosamine transferase